MKQLIKIYENKGQKLVNARELHTFLNSKQEFANWIKNRIEKYGFEKGRDFLTILSKSNGGRPLTDYGLTIDMAKELCMVENNDKGRQARRYFIEMEQQVKNKSVQSAPSRKELARWVIELEERAERQQQQIDTLQPKAQLMDKVMDTDSLIDIGQVAKVLDLGFGRNTLFKKLREKGVLFKNRNEPRQQFIERGYFVMKENFIERENHEGFVVLKTLVTQKGLNFIHELFENEKPQIKMALLQ